MSRFSRGGPSEFSALSQVGGSGLCQRLQPADLGVLLDQHAAARSGGVALRRHDDGRGHGGARHADAEYRAFAFPGFDGHGAVQQPREPAHDREPEPEAFGPLRAAIDLVELLKDALQLVGRNADTGIADFDIQSGAVRPT